MGKALERVANCEILRSHPKLTFCDGPYAYTITRDGDESAYEVTDGHETLKTPLEWAFRQGGAGQTYVFEKNGNWYESRVSFFNDVQGLGLTLGATTAKPASIDEAAGRLMSPADARDCFDCHSTGALHAHKLDIEDAIPGVECENCHGPGAAHVHAIRAGNAKAAKLVDLSSLSTEDMSDFCGRCHRTWAQIVSQGLRSVIDVRFQPYRLTNSRCYDAVDKRIRCTACHDPHRQAVRDKPYYDAKCQACQASAAKACRVGRRNCVPCHMPKVALPGAHHQFTDHEIRIVRPGAPYPD
jgi:hypothetical protein